MKLSKNTLAILKNFATINQSIMMEPGNTLRTISANKSIAAIAEIEEEIPTLATVYELPRFLSVIGMYDDPEIDFGETAFTISDGKRTVLYHYADPSIIIAPKKKTVNFPAPDVEAVLMVENLESVLKAASVLQLKDIAFCGKNGRFIVRAMESDGTKNDTFDVEIGETEEEFNLVIKAANFKFITQQYKVELSRKGISKFTGENGIEYYVAVSAKGSNFEDQ